MTRLVFLIVGCAAFVLWGGPADSVDTRLGTEIGRGSCMVGPCVPHGSVYPSPDSVWPAEGRRFPAPSGRYVGDKVTGFSQLHTQGTGGTPSYGLFRVSFGDSSDLEILEAHPYRLRTRLADLGIEVAVSATAHGAIYAYDSRAVPTVDVYGKIGKAVASTNATMTAEGDVLFGGGTYAGNWNPAPYDCWFYATREPGCLRLAVSFKSIAQAKAYHDAELAGRTLDEVAAAARDLWNAKLAAVTPSGLSAADETIFYTHLFHVFVQPRDRMSDGLGWDDHYTLWDTWKTLFPLLTLVDPETVAGNVNHSATRFAANGRCESCYTQGRDYKVGQGGDEIDCIVADALVKDVPGVDGARLVPLLVSRWTGRTAGYRTRGFVADGEREDYCGRMKSGSATLSFAYQDHCVGTALAKLRGAEDAQASAFLKRAGNWTNVWDAAAVDRPSGITGFAGGRAADGTFPRPDPRKGYNQSFYEATGWEYSFFAPHAMEELFVRCGGREAFVSRLRYALDEKLVDFGNEPSFLTPWLFTFAGRPDLSSKYAHEVLKLFPANGCPGDDDSGAMGSFYVFLNAGLMPVAGSDLYLLHAPAVPKLSLTFPASGKVLTIEAPGARRGRWAYQSVTFNGKPITDGKIRHAELLAGGSLRYALAPGRERTSFNDGWTLEKDGKTAAVAVPHDWAIAGPFDPKAPGGTGKLPWKGKGVYRRTLVLAQKPAGRVFLDFDGVMARATVFVNGEPCGTGDYGYLGFRADATPYLMAGTNLVEVKCDTLSLSSRWYPGGGLYRNTWLVTTDDVFLKDDALRIVTRDVLSGEPTVEVAGTVVSKRPGRTSGAVSVRLRDASGQLVAETASPFAVDGYDQADFRLSFKAKNPRLWEMEENATLYVVEASFSGEDAADTLERRIGFREFRFDADDGFFLNGQRVQLKGVDLHADLGPLGVAFDKDAMRRQLSIMRDMGANALRTSHNCPAPEVLDLCDEMGFFVWDECFDKWNETCGRGDEPLETFVPRILSAWVRRDRNHPCVFAWSIGNEISPGTAAPPGQEDLFSGRVAIGTSAERCAEFRRAVRREDDTRPVAIGSCFAETVVGRGDYASLDLTGWNYGGQYDRMKRRHPDKPVLYSESASAVSEYGFYSVVVPTGKTDFARNEHRVDSRDLNAARWSDVPDREFFRMERDRYCCGEFVWTGIDYLGEPYPYMNNMNALDDSRSSYFGVCDLCAFPKDRFYLYRSHWNERDFTLHLVPAHWTFLGQEGRKMPVQVYTSADEAELFLNGRSLGRRRKDRAAGSLEDYYSVLPRYRLLWSDVVYEPGELRVVAYGRDGREEGSETLQTAGVPVRIVLTPERPYGSLCVVKVSLADAAGNFVPDDNRRIAFHAEECEILAIGNSDPRGYDSFKDVASHPLCAGRAAVYVRLFGGQPTLRASCEGLKEATASF